MTPKQKSSTSPPAAPSLPSPSSILKLIFHDAQAGILNVWNKQPKKSRSTYYDITRLTELDAAFTAARETGNYYFSITLLRKPGQENQRAHAADAQLLPAFVFDLDFGPVGHAKKGSLPAGRSEANSFLESLEFQPSLVIETGGGFHLYYILDQSLSLLTEDSRHTATDRLASFHSYLKRAGQEFQAEWDLDITAELTQQYRLPYSLNFKHQPPLPVQVHPRYSKGLPRYSTAQLAQWTGYKPDTLNRKKNSKLEDQAESLGPDSDKILEGCRFLQHCRADASTLSEPEWHSMLNILFLTRDGDRIIHEWSQPYPRYSATETQSRIDQLHSKQLGPLLCDTVAKRTGSQYCEPCPHYHKISTPVQLGIDHRWKEFLYILSTNQFYNCYNGQSYSRESFCALMAAEVSSMNADAILLTCKWFERVEGITYDPTQQQRITTSEGISQINLYRPNPLLSKFNGDLAECNNPAAEKLIHNHLVYLFPEEGKRLLLLQWMAWIVQHPAERIRYACVVIGPQGIGKSWLADLMTLVLGRKNVGTVNNELLHLDFTDWAEAKQLIRIDESMAAGRRDLMNRLKPMITDPFITINKKFIPTYLISNWAHFFMFSNHRDALLIDNMDRRYMLLDTEVAPQNPAYYEQLFSLVEPATPEKAAAARLFFQSVDLTGFGHTTAPMTAEKELAIEVSYSPLEFAFKERYHNQEVPFHADLVSISDVNEYFSQRLRIHAAAEVTLLPLFFKYGARKLGQVRLLSGQKKSLWVIRRHELWAKTLETGNHKPLAEHYERSRDALAREPGGHPFEGQEEM